ILSGSGDGTLKVWDAATGQELLTLKDHQGAVLSMAISPDGNRIVSGSADGTVKVWDAHKGRDVFSLGKNALSLVNCVAFSPDGRRIVTGTIDSSTRGGGRPLYVLKVWDARKGQLLLALKGHASVITCVAVSPDGKRIASGSGPDHQDPGKPAELKV